MNGQIKLRCIEIHCVQEVYQPLRIATTNSLRKSHCDIAINVQ